MKPETFTAGEQPSTSYETLLKPYGTPAEVLAMVRMGGMLSFNGDRLTNFAWSIAELAELGGAFNDAMQSADCPAHINSGTLGALLVSIQASSHAIQRILDEALEIGDLAGIRRGKGNESTPQGGGGSRRSCCRSRVPSGVCRCSSRPQDQRPDRDHSRPHALW